MSAADGSVRPRPFGVQLGDGVARLGVPRPVASSAEGSPGAPGMPAASPLPGVAVDAPPLPPAAAASAPSASSSVDIEAGTGLPLPQSGPPSATTSYSGSRPESAGEPQHTVTARSVWRWPSQPGKLPAYVENTFRVKTFGLLTIQFAVVFGIMVLVELYVPFEELFPKREQYHVVFVGVGILTMVVLTSLYCLKDRYPANYLLLSVVTVMVGFYWGMGHTIFASKLHFQLVGIMGIAVFIATITSAALSYRSKMDSWCVVLTSVYFGWAVGSVVDLTLIRHFPALQGQWELVAVLVAFFLFTVLILDVGSKLALCNPDDFMRVIISMDSALLVVVSIPIFIISACLLHTDDYPEILGGARQQAEPRDRAVQQQ